jgi:hypothetical protein
MNKSACFAALIFAATSTLVCSQTKAKDSAAPAPAVVTQTAVTPAASVPTFGNVAFDSALTDQARIYAGMLPLDSARYPKLTSGKGWATHHKIFEADWANLDKRLQAMEQWRATEMGGISTTGTTLFYPFSGPDFLNADVFFPACEASVYISLEKTGEIPSPQMTEKTFVNFTEDIRTSLSAIFQRNYFITSRMSEQLHTPYLKGNLTLFMVFLARRNCAIVAINKIHIDSNGTLIEAPCDTGKAKRKQIAGMEIQYVKSGGDGKVQKLYYFSIDIQDSALKLKTPLQTYLRSIDNMVVLAKAASYLMHGDNFSIVRNLCLRAKAVLQDDTGVPYRFFKPAEWSVTLYGNYTKPIKDFKYGFQTDLDKAFRSGNNVKPLPFNIGYHWQDSYSSLILAIKTDTSSARSIIPVAPDTSARVSK